MKKIQEIKHKTPYFYASAASFVLCLLLIFFSLKRQEKIDGIKVGKAKEIVDSTVRLQEQVAGAVKNKDSLMGQLREALNLLSGRDNWIDILNEIQSKIPDNMWLVSITVGTGAGAPTSTTAAEAAPAEDRPVFPIFRPRGGRGAAQAVDAGKVEWIDLEGYFFGAASEIDTFKKSLQTSSTVFSDKPADLIGRGFEPPKDEKNSFSSFKISIKLKAPFNR